MVRAEVAARKIARANSWIVDAAAILARPLATFLADRRERDLACFYLQLAIQEAIDLAAHWLSDEGWSAPADAAGTFTTLAERGAISAALADRLRAAVGVRNRIAHGYATLDHRRLHAEATDGLQSVREFLAAVSAVVARDT